MANGPDARHDSAAPPEMNPASPGRRSVRGPADFVVASVVQGWRWLRRMKTALMILGVIGVFTLIATVVPQEPNVAPTVASWRAGTAGPGTFISDIILDPIGAYDVYGSPAFLLLVFTLFTSLTACLIPRTRSYWKLVRHSRPPRLRRVNAQPERAQLRTTLDAEAVVEVARGRLGAKWRLRADSDDDAGPVQVAAERGHVMREGGSLVFHFSFYVLFTAIVFGQLLGFSGQVGVVEGEGFSDTQVSYWTREPGRWWTAGDHRGFTLEVEEFIVDWYRESLADCSRVTDVASCEAQNLAKVTRSGTPKVFLADLAITPAGGDLYRERVGGNDPVDIDGMKVHLLDWGYAPRVVVAVDGKVVHDAFIPMQRSDGFFFFNGAVKVPSVDPDLGAELFFWPYAPDQDGDGPELPTLTGAPWPDAPLLAMQLYRGDLGLDSPQRVDVLDTRLLDESGEVVLTLGQATVDGEVTVIFPELRRWVGLQVSTEPTQWALLLGAGMLFFGLFPALYAFRRRLWVIAEPQDDGSTLVTVLGRAFQRSETFSDEFATVVGALRDDLLAAQRVAGGPDNPDDEDTTATGPAQPDPDEARTRKVT